jgi:hypothetical protein
MTDKIAEKINYLTSELLAQQKLTAQYRMVADANRRWAEDTEEVLQKARSQLYKAERRAGDIETGSDFLLRRRSEELAASRAERDDLLDRLKEKERLVDELLAQQDKENEELACLRYRWSLLRKWADQL